MEIALDLDGVLCNFSQVAIDTIRELRMVDLPADYVHTAWSFEDVLQPGQWGIVFDHLMRRENFWMRLPAFEENVEALRAYIEDHGDKGISFITARPESNGANAVVQTQLWLLDKKIGPLGMEVFIAQGADAKRQVIEGERIQFFLDDSPANVRICQDLPDHRAFLLDQPYNRHDIDLPRVYSVAEFLLEVEAAS